MKYRKLLCLAATVGLVVTAVTGCGSKATETSEKATVVAETISPIEEAVSEEQEVETEVAEESPYLYPVIGEREVVDGKIQSYLTGEWTDESKANRRPIAVSIPNQKSCLPKY